MIVNVGQMGGSQAQGNLHSDDQSLPDLDKSTNEHILLTMNDKNSEEHCHQVQMNQNNNVNFVDLENAKSTTEQLKMFHHDQNFDQLNTESVKSRSQTPRYDISGDQSKHDVTSNFYDPDCQEKRDTDTKLHENSSKVYGYTKPDLYDGTTSWTDYFSHFQMVCKLNNWPDDVKALKLATSLRGSARCIISDLKPEQLENYSELLTLLKNRFEPKTQSEMYRAQMNARIRTNGESLTDLAQDVKRLVRLAYPTAPSEVRDSLGYRCFRDALNDHEMEWAVYQSSSESIEEALNLALKYEAFQMSRRRKSTRQSLRQQTLVDNEMTSIPDANKFECNSNEMKTLIDRVAKLEEKSPKNDSKKKFDGKCFYCQKIGHIQRDCRKRLRDQKSSDFTTTDKRDHNTSKPLNQ